LGANAVLPSSKMPAPSGPRVFLLAGTADGWNAQVAAGLPPDATLHFALLEADQRLDEAVHALRPDMLILCCDLPSDGMFRTLGKIANEAPLPVVVFVAADRPNSARRALAAGVSAYIVNGLAPDRIRPVVEVAAERFRIITALQRELQKSRDDLAARKVIERAKGLLMERRGLNERGAYEAMRKLAMMQGRTLMEVAETVLSLSDILP